MEIPGGGCPICGHFRLVPFLFRDFQRLNHHIVGKMIRFCRVDSHGFRGKFLRWGRFGDEQTGVALVLAQGVLKNIPADRLMAPGVGTGVDADSSLPDPADGAADFLVSIGEYHLIPHLIGGLALQTDRWPLDRLMGESVQPLLIQSAENVDGFVPASTERGFFIVLFI